MHGSEDLKTRILKAAKQEGFTAVRIASAAAIEHDAPIQRWLSSGFESDMRYMRRNLEKRLDPRKLEPWTRSIVCLAMSYMPPANRNDTICVARYARGKDYHKVLKKRAHRLIEMLRRWKPGVQARAFVDSAPVAERSLAVRCGLGWIGKNGCLIVPEVGSYVVLAEIFTDLTLSPDSSIEPKCGSCNACVEACETGALHDGLVDARKCLSHLTQRIQTVDETYRSAIATRLFACDTCQEVCPHNRHVPAGDPELAPALSPLGGATLLDILRWSEEDWDSATRGTALRQAKYPVLLRNALIASVNYAISHPGDERFVSSLHRAIGSFRRRGVLSSELIDWALLRIT